jgi:flagellar M-ring protein FliF
MGNIRRLSAAVVLNHRKDVDKAGKPITKPIPDAEMKQINELVREAMGFTRSAATRCRWPTPPSRPSTRAKANCRSGRIRRTFPS